MFSFPALKYNLGDNQERTITSGLAMYLGKKGLMNSFVTEESVDIFDSIQNSYTSK